MNENIEVKLVPDGIPFKCSKCGNDTFIVDLNKIKCSVCMHVMGYTYDK